MNNPLLSPQREKSGSQTLKKYSYQYHWALQKAILEHGKKVEYAVFIELHEDVIFTNALDHKKATFEFNQVKTDRGAYTKHKLVKLKNGKSVLGKLLDSTNQKPYSTKITGINLVSVNGFSLELKNKGYKFEKLNISDIEDNEQNDISKKIAQEISISRLPTTINFIIPRLKEDNHQHAIIGEISQLISTISPMASYNPIHIYQLLIDDLLRKGQDEFDYKKWDEALMNKALTSQKVTETINKYTSHKNESIIESEFVQISDELGYNSIQRKEIRRAYTRYKNQAYGSRSSFQLNLSFHIRNLINDEFANSNNQIEKLIHNVINRFSENFKTTFNSENEIIGAIIYEFITTE